ncbi:phytoene/squalene synthase family protein [Roseobacter sp. HKCCA0434]|uniref:phytoene/squalene synthase family protein n=1 Tax=Roseobacter sp. HKCCA0434 TaxID=3079297 RepID=UPI002905F662|nr:squalene/phytoene synthase family protein [Roseobacter sp. HKCCA0434]
MSWQPCAEIVERADPDRFLSAMTASEAGRAALFPLYAFNAEVAKAPWVTSEPGLAEIRLQWWRDAIGEIYAGAEPRRHEVVTPLAEVIGARNLPRFAFDALIDARAFDIYEAGHVGTAALDAYLAATSAGLMELAMRSTGGDAVDLARGTGWAQGAAGLMRALPVLWSSGRDPLPVPGGLDRQAVLAGKMPDAVAKVLRDLAGRALDRIAPVPRDLPEDAKAALRAAWQAPRILRTVQRDPSAIFGRLDVSEFRRRGGLLVRTLRGR